MTPPAWVLAKVGSIHTDPPGAGFDPTRIQFIFEWAITKGFTRQAHLTGIPQPLWGKIPNSFQVLIEGKVSVADDEVMAAYERNEFLEPPGRDSEAYLIFKTQYEWQRQHYAEIVKKLAQIQLQLAELGIATA